MQTCHHLHGGMGMDITYPMHRYCSSIKDLTRCWVARRIASTWWERNVHRTDPEQRHLQGELRQYFSNLISAEERAEMEVDRHGKAYRAIIKRMGSDGKLGVGWPKEYGGHGFGPVEQSIFVNEAARADVPLPAVTLQTVGPTLQEYGTRLRRKVPSGHPGR